MDSPLDPMDPISHTNSDPSSQPPLTLTPRQSIDVIDNYVDLLSSEPDTTTTTPTHDPDTDTIVSPLNLPIDSPKSSQPSTRKLASSLNKKRIIFIRHAKSTWNEASEKSVDRVSALTKGIFESMYYNKKDIKDGGKYIDAPLSDLGILQSMDFNRFVQHHYTRHTLKSILKASSSKRPSSIKSPEEEHKEQSSIFEDIDRHRKSIADELEALSSTSKIRQSFQKLHDLISQKQTKYNVVYDNIDIENDDGSVAMKSAKDDKNKNKHKLRDKLIAKDLLSLMGMDHNSCVLTSNLRRTIDTAIISLSARFQTFPLENIYILSCLQEFGKGPDCISRTEAKDIPKIAQYTQNHKRINLEALQSFYTTRIDSSMNYGPKKDDNISRFDRMLEFCRYVFQRQESTVIVVGHSIWFQRFCKIFLLQQNHKNNKQKKDKKDSNSSSNDKDNNSNNNKKKKNHISISSKLYNTGCVGFDLCRIIKGSTDYYGIDSRTMTVIYKGFEKMDRMSSNTKQQ